MLSAPVVPVRTTNDGPGPLCPGDDGRISADVGHDAGEHGPVLYSLPGPVSSVSPPQACRTSLNRGAKI